MCGGWCEVLPDHDVSVPGMASQLTRRSDAIRCATRSDSTVFWARVLSSTKSHLRCRLCGFGAALALTSSWKVVDGDRVVGGDRVVASTSRK